MLHGRPTDRDNAMLILPSDDGKYAKRSPTGIYSPIVCAQCEASFQRGDDELIRLLRTLAEGAPVASENGRALAREYPHIDSSMLNRGILTTLFRAHLSPHEAYHRVDLGPYAEEIRQLVCGQGTTIGAEFDVVLRVIKGPIGGHYPLTFSGKVEWRECLPALLSEHHRLRQSRSAPVWRALRLCSAVTECGALGHH